MGIAEEIQRLKKLRQDGIISTVLCLVIIGVFLWIVLGILLILFPIIGGIKASSGELWPYPMSIDFCGVE